MSVSGGGASMKSNTTDGPSASASGARAGRNELEQPFLPWRHRILSAVVVCTIGCVASSSLACPGEGIQRTPLGQPEIGIYVYYIRYPCTSTHITYHMGTHEVQSCYLQSHTMANKPRVTKLPRHA